MRLFDLIMSLTGILFLSPLLLIATLLIRLTSGGPVIYSHERVGLRGRLFRLYKFRSMVNNADQVGTSVTASGDTRITGIGKILRTTKLDELPQLFNVLKGDMSFVGPRPDVPEIVNSYTTEMRRILDVRPGITSIASLYLHYEEKLLARAHCPDRAYELIFIPAKIKLAMEHVNRRSLLFNFKILLLTVWSLTCERIWHGKEHPVIEEIKYQIFELNRRTEENRPFCSPP